MIHILLTILKIAGILIACVLTLALLVLILVLFVPIRYRMEFVWEEEQKAVLKVNWLLHLISGKLYCRNQQEKNSFQVESNVQVKLFGFLTIYDANRKEKAEEKKTNKEKKKKKPENVKKTELDTVPAEAMQKTESASADTKEKMQQSVKQEETPEEKRKTERKAIPNEKPKQRTGIREKWNCLLQKLKKLWKWIADACKNSKYTLQRIYDTIKNIGNTIQYYYELWQSEEAKTAYALCKKQITVLWKNIRPRKYRIYLHIGNEDPKVVGDMMAVYGILYPLYGSKVAIVPEFEKNVLEVNAFIKGRITIFVLLKVLGIIYFDKNLKRFLSMLKREEKNV